MPIAQRRTNNTQPKARIIINGPSDGASALKARLLELGVDCSKVTNGHGPRLQRRFNLKWGAFAMNAVDYGGPMTNGNSGETSLNKRLCFEALHAAGVPTPQFTSEIEVARRWIAEGCRRIYERHTLRGSEGAGIRIVGDGGEDQDLRPAPLYVKGMFGRRREYRIHVFSVGETRRIFIQQKKRRTSGVNPADNATESTIRNLAHGWVFAHNDIVSPRQATIDAAVAAVRACDLQFGAVDMIEMDRAQDGGSVVLEINCAPGLQGGTLDFYAHAISDHLHGVVREIQPEVAPEGVTQEAEGVVFGGMADPEA